MSTPFQIVILGSGSAYPGKQRHHTAQFITIGRDRLLLDCGEGTQFRMVEEGVWAPHRILLTHAHGDHFLGLPGLLLSLASDYPGQPLQIYAPASLYEEFGFLFRSWWAGLSLDLPLVRHIVPTDIPALVFQSRFARVWSFPVEHSVPTVGYWFCEHKPPWKLHPERLDTLQIPPPLRHRLQWGKPVQVHNQWIDPSMVGEPAPPPRTYAYITDTRALRCESLPPFLKNVDVLYHEATYAQADAHLAHRHYHSTAQDAAHIARQCNARLLLIGHASSRYAQLDLLVNEARKIFPNTFYAEEGLRVTIEETRILVQTRSQNILATIPRQHTKSTTDFLPEKS